MKNIVFAFCLTLLSVTEVLTQPPPIKPQPPTNFTPCVIPEGGCSEPWGPLQSKQIEIDCGGTLCTLEVFFKTRIACAGTANFYDLSIGWAQAVGSSWICGFCLDGVLLQEQMAQKLMQIQPSLWGNTILPDQCVVTYRAQASSCWEDGVWPFMGEHVGWGDWWWVPCSWATCCVRPWQVCNRYGAYIATPLGPGVPTSPIPEYCSTYVFNPEVNGHSCYITCP